MIYKMKRCREIILFYHLQVMDQEGQGLIEYILLVLLIAVALISGLISLGVTLPAIFQLIIEQLQNDRR